MVIGSLHSDVDPVFRQFRDFVGLSACDANRVEVIVGLDWIGLDRFVWLYGICMLSPHADVEMSSPPISMEPSHTEVCDPLLFLFGDHHHSVTAQTLE
jgi:hypothetical protein